ncbi:DedA family protein [Acidiferrobacter sp.]|jgi:membrane protein DedA with SNARE-associated domain|uniref:DedA family protein n=1 Tax=Acidiferrobacter sp. TaxID=1872107 RepID=UPI002608112B|nr:DedA family protein [Acidiferrobacter sp.]
MSLTHLIHVYGYIAILVGCFLEGETVLVLGGVAAAQGYLVLPGVMAAAFIGSLSGDQLFFHLGRRYGPDVVARKPRLRKANARLQDWIGRHENLLVLSFRFLYGLRSAAPFVFGASPIRRARFTLLNAAGAAVWAVTVGYGGYVAGHVLATILSRFAHYEWLFLLVIAAAAAGIWLLTRYRS